MIEIVNVVGVEALGGHRLRIYFSDGRSGVRDFGDLCSLAGPMIEPLKDVDVFKRVFVSMGVLTWPNGFDLDSIQLHSEMQKAGELQHAHLSTQSEQPQTMRYYGSAVRVARVVKSSASKSATAVSEVTKGITATASSVRIATAASKVLSTQSSKAAKASAATALTQSASKRGAGKSGSPSTQKKK